VTNLELALIGNGAIAALVSSVGEIVWGCFPAMDGDPRSVRCCASAGGRTTSGTSPSTSSISRGRNSRTWATRRSCAHACTIATAAAWKSPTSRPVCPLRAALLPDDARAASAPRHWSATHPCRDATGRQCRRHAPRHHDGQSSHPYVDGDPVLRLTTDVSISAIVEERAFVLEEAVTLVLGPDESLQGSARDIGERFARDTTSHWREWVRSLAIPFEWQDAVIRAAIHAAVECRGGYGSHSRRDNDVGA